MKNRRRRHLFLIRELNLQRALLSDYRKWIPLLSEFICVNQLICSFFHSVCFSLLCSPSYEECFPEMYRACLLLLSRDVPAVFFGFCFSNVFVNSFIYFVMCCHDVSQCCCSTVCFCDIAIIQFINTQGKMMHFLKITLVKVHMYKDTHLRSFFFYREWTVCRYTITTVDWRESPQSYFSPLCYTANKRGAVNMQILYFTPNDLTTILLTLFSCKLYLSQALCVDVSVLSHVFEQRIKTK